MMVYLRIYCYCDAIFSNGIQRGIDTLFFICDHSLQISYMSQCKMAREGVLKHEMHFDVFVNIHLYEWLLV